MNGSAAQLCVRQSTIHLFRHLDEASLDRVGLVNNNTTTARGVGYVIVGHERHHLAILKERYLAASAYRFWRSGRHDSPVVRIFWSSVS